MRGSAEERMHPVGRGANINSTDRRGQTPLFEQYIFPQLIVKLLIKHGTNRNIQDIDGCTALHWEMNHNIVDLLLQSGATANVRNHQAITAI